MKLDKLIEKEQFKNDAVRICEFLGFNDTDQLKKAKFFSMEQSYSPIPVIGWGVSNGDRTWRLCKVVNDPNNPSFNVDEGYKIKIQICDNSGYGCEDYYQSTFLSFLEKGMIVYAPENTKIHIKHIKWAEQLYNNNFIVHEANVLVDENENIMERKV